MNFFKTLFAVLIAQIIIVMAFVFGLGLIGLGLRAGDKPDVEDGSWLVIDVYGEIMPYDPPESIMSEIMDGDGETVYRILANLEKAAVDDRIAGVIVRVSSNNDLGYAAIEEIRDAIGRVREEGKPVYAHSDALNRKGLFLAAACDSVFMVAGGDLDFVGMAAVRPFFKGTLDKLGIKPNLHKIEDYKSAAEPFLRTDMSPEAEEMMNWMMDELWDMEQGGISEDRGIAREKLVEHMEHMMFTADEAHEAGLIDGTLYWDELEDRLKGEDDDELRTVSQEKYAEIERTTVGLKGKKRIAVVHAHGLIGGRKSHVDGMMGPMMGHETVVSHLRRAAEDDKVDAIVFRIDSNGGESLASDIIAHEVERVRDKKPIVVSMMDVAASGGYMIAYRASKVVADPMTITGSIGSISGKFNTSGMYRKIGMTFDWVTKGPNGLVYSGQTDFTKGQWDRFVDHHWDGFNRWLEDVSEERGIPMDDLIELAYGRVWTGRQAKENGLIDELGGLERAIEIAKEAADIPLEDDVTIVHYPRKRGLFAMLTSGKGPMGLASWVIYRFTRHDLAETVRWLTSSTLYVWTGEVVR
jgi:protease-4